MDSEIKEIRDSVVVLSTRAVLAKTDKNNN
jgi:hypothetical protein